jgi:hypothetical protein
MHVERRGEQKKLRVGARDSDAKKLMPAGSIFSIAEAAFIDTLTGLFSHPISDTWRPAFRAFDRRTSAMDL